jgi:hypothetical protein
MNIKLFLLENPSEYQALDSKLHRLLQKGEFTSKEVDILSIALAMRHARDKSMADALRKSVDRRREGGAG